MKVCERKRIYKIWIDSRKVGENSRFTDRIYRIKASGIYKRTRFKLHLDLCRLASPRQSNRFPSQPYPPGDSNNIRYICRWRKALNS
jgi:hypothetical protein